MVLHNINNLSGDVLARMICNNDDKQFLEQNALSEDIIKKFDQFDLVTIITNKAVGQHFLQMCQNNPLLRTVIEQLDQDRLKDVIYKNQLLDYCSEKQSLQCIIEKLDGSDLANMLCVLERGYDADAMRNVSKKLFYSCRDNELLKEIIEKLGQTHISLVLTDKHLGQEFFNACCESGLIAVLARNVNANLLATSSLLNEMCEKLPDDSYMEMIFNTKNVLDYMVRKTDQELYDNIVSFKELLHKNNINTPQQLSAYIKTEPNVWLEIKDLLKQAINVVLRKDNCYITHNTAKEQVKRFTDSVKHEIKQRSR